VNRFAAQNVIWSLAGLAFGIATPLAVANPYPYEEDIAVDANPVSRGPATPPRLLAPADLGAEGLPVLRVQVRWNQNTDDFSIEKVERERSGTEAFATAARYDDPHGSYKARLTDAATGRPLSFAVLGTGSGFRKLTRMLTFRFPLPAAPVRFELTAENGDSGVMESVIDQTIDPAAAAPSPPVAGLDVRILREATATPKLVVNIYADGYTAARVDQFWVDAARVPSALAAGDFPMLEHFEFRGVFSPSAEALGSPRNLGLPVPVRDSFLGLYYPYWHNFGRYFHVVYPTSELKYRRAIGSVPYDYPIALLDSDSYWGVGNFKELTAVPARNDRFGYLLRHEFGHFFGLNEEYESGGATELSFAPQIDEPWSQNITFHPQRDQLKWGGHVASGTRLPTPSGDWDGKSYGAYPGGYGETPHSGAVYKPGRSCTMNTGASFCAICAGAIAERVKIDLGLASPPVTASGCGCKADPADGGRCALLKNGEPLAWTPLFGGKTCDQTFCAQYFKLSLKNHCGQ
jgi:hypothetical protein